MRTNLSMINLSRRVKNAAAALLFLTAYTISAIGPFVPVASAALLPGSDISVASFPFGIKNSSSYSEPGGVPTAQGSFKNGNVGAYVEGACIPTVFEVKNTSNSAGDISLAAVFDHFNSPTIGIDNLEAITYSGTGNPVDNITNLNQLGYPKSNLSVVSSFKNSTASSTAANITGPYSGNSTSTNAFVYGSSTFGHYNINLTDVQSNQTVYVAFCARLSLDASDYSGSSLSIRTAGAGAENIPIPVNSLLKRPSITVTKTVQGGDAKAEDFSFTITPSVNGQSVFDISPGTNSVIIDNIYPSGEYKIVESGPTGYSFSEGSGVQCETDPSSIGLAAGAMMATVAAAKNPTNATCNFTNDRQSGTVTLVKSVINNNGGQLGVDDFGLTIRGTSVSSGQSLTLPSGVPVAINEAGNANYDFVSITGDGCPSTLGGTVTPVNGQNITCTIKNDDKAPSLTLNKVVEIDNGGGATENQWTLTADGAAAGTLSGPGAAGDTDVISGANFKVGTYSLSESDGPAGYSASDWSCTGTDTQSGSTITLGFGQSAVCTITNSDIAPQLTVIKHVVNKYGGTATADLFTMDITGTKVANSSFAGSEAGITTSLAAGSYSVGEHGGPLGYSARYSDDCSGTIKIGETRTCTVTNSDTSAMLSGVKYEVNADAIDGTGATGLPNWTICLDADNSGTCDDDEQTTTTDPNGAYSFTNLSLGTYSLIESLGGSMDGWTQIFAPIPVTLGLGGESTSNDFGNFKNGDIHGFKWNDLNGDGKKTSDEPKLQGWTIFIDKDGDNVLDTNEASTITDGQGNYSFDNLAPGTYTICEVMQAGWAQTAPATASKCSSRTINISGESNTIKFGNQARGSLTVVKNVDDGFGKVSNNVNGWTWDYDGDYQDGSNETASSTNTVGVPADIYTINEDQQKNYHFTSVSCTKNGQPYTATSAESFDVTVGAGDAVVCTFLNTRDTANITVTKVVNNNHGGQAKVSDFDLYVDETKVTSGVSQTFVTSTSYDISEKANVDGYTQKSLKCWLANDVFKVDLTETFTLTYGNDVECEIVNNDIAPKLTVYKYVDNGYTNLTKTSSDFTMLVDGTNVSDDSFAGSYSGTTVTLDVGNYNVTEGNHDGYDMYMQGLCDSTIDIGEENNCYIYNYAIEDPQINVVKSGPTQAHEGDTVTYTFTVTNPGNVPFPQVQVDDDIAGAGTYVSGDTSDDGYLDPGETWIYTADYVIPAGQIDDVYNTVTACYTYGFEEDSFDRQQEGFNYGCDTDDHTLDVLHPSLVVVKSGPVNAQLGTTGTYTFTVTNTGDTPLDVTKVLDDIAGTGIYVSGDTNTDGMLDLDETWIFTANYKFTKVGSIKDTVDVCGIDALELEVCAEDDHTTIVYTPQVLGLEDTGTNITAPLFLSTGLLGLAVLAMLQRRRFDEVAPRE